MEGGFVRLPGRSPTQTVYHLRGTFASRGTSAASVNRLVDTPPGKEYTLLHMKQTHYYTDERNVQIIIALLKAHGIKKVIASPGTTNVGFLGSIEFDPWFQVWSAVDERHAAYMACGMAYESGEPVVLTCTGASAARNYLPGLTEAFYRKLPILALTTTSKSISRTGNLFGQQLDHSVLPKDAARYSAQCRTILTDEQFHDCERLVNEAILELFRHGGGPVHLNYETTFDTRFSVEKLPSVRKMERHFGWEKRLPAIASDARIIIAVGAHKSFSESARKALEQFARTYDAVVLCDSTSSYSGANRISSSLLCSQRIGANPAYGKLKPDLIIHIGEICNDYATYGYLPELAPVWRVSEDGELRDRWGWLEKVFEMREEDFFSRYADGIAERHYGYCKAWQDADAALRTKIPELPFSNLWMASQLVPRIPSDAFLYLGVSTTLQSWNVFVSGSTFASTANVGCCGIDGCVSGLVGASLANEHRLHFGVVGDLTFFYDMNAIGNRHIKSNLRLLVVNNGCGAIFHSRGYATMRFGEDEVDRFHAAGGHFGNKSTCLIRDYALALGFKYIAATDKNAFAKAVPEFISDSSDKPILLECFTDAENEAQAKILKDSIDRYFPPQTLKDEIKKMVPQGVKDLIKGAMKR